MMKIRIEEKEYEGSGVEILEQLRRETFEECPDAETYLWQLQTGFIRLTGLDFRLPDTGLERQAQVLFAMLAKAGAMEILSDD